MTAEPARPAGPLAVLADGLTVAAGSSRLLRDPSIYLGLLTLALAGPGVVSQLWLLSWSESIDLTSQVVVDAANEAIGLSAFLLVLALGGLIAVSIEGGAIGVVLIGGRVMARPVTLRVALERSRRVFWRLVRAALAIGVIEIAVSFAWRFATNAPAIVDGLPNVALEPVPGAITAAPFIYSTVAIVIADDGTRAALRRSVRLARQRPRLTIALAAFALLSGVLEGLALGSGLDLIVRVTEGLHLDIAAGGASLVLAIGLGLAIVTATGSLIFTVSAIVSAPQIVAWHRLGLSTDGLPAAPPADPAAEPAAAADVAPPPSPMAEAVAAFVAEPVGEPPGVPGPPMVAPGTPAPPIAHEPVLAAQPVAPARYPALVPEPSAWALASEPSAWALAAAARPRFRWVTIPMRLTAVGLWLVAIASIVGGPPI